MVAGDQVDVSLTVNPASTGEGCRWKGSWLVSWSEIHDQDRIWVADALPAGSVPAGNGEGWTWVDDPPPYQGAGAPVRAGQRDAPALLHH